MDHCVFLGCFCNSRHRRNGVTFHEFPDRQVMRDRWVALVREDRADPTWVPEEDTRVCSLHFSRDAFLGRNTLMYNAMPRVKYAPPNFLRLIQRRSPRPNGCDMAELTGELDGAAPEFELGADTSNAEHSYSDTDEPQESDKEGGAGPPKRNKLADEEQAEPTATTEPTAEPAQEEKPEPTGPNDE